MNKFVKQIIINKNVQKINKLNLKRLPVFGMIWKIAPTLSETVEAITKVKLKVKHVYGIIDLPEEKAKSVINFTTTKDRENFILSDYGVTKLKENRKLLEEIKNSNINDTIHDIQVKKEKNVYMTNIAYTTKELEDVKILDELIEKNMTQSNQLIEKITELETYNKIVLPKKIFLDTKLINTLKEHDPEFKFKLSQFLNVKYGHNCKEIIGLENMLVGLKYTEVFQTKEQFKEKLTNNF